MSTRSTLARLAQLSFQQQHAHLSPEIFLLRLPDLLKALQLSRASVYAKLKLGGKYFDPNFPRPISLSPSGRGGVAWVASEVEAWVQQQIQKRDSGIVGSDAALSAVQHNLPAVNSVCRSSLENLRDEDAFLPDIHSTRKASAIGICG